MSACSDFAEHVWKPGSCKNCFHQLSAHKTATGPGGGVAAASQKSGKGDEDAAVTALSPYSKPTIAVKPTMISLDTTESLIDDNMNKDQENTKSPMERRGLKKLLDLSSLYINGNSCTKAHRDQQSPDSKKDFPNCFSPGPLSPNIKDSKIISNIFVSHEDVRCPQSTKKNGDLNCWQQNSANISSTKSTYNGNGATNRAHYLENRQTSVESSCSDNGPCSPSRVFGNGCKSPTSPFKTSTSIGSPTRVEAGPGPQDAVPASPALSPQSSLSDTLSYRSSTDSLPIAESSGGRQESPKRPPALASCHSAPCSPSAQDKEPIYAESTKKKSKPNNSAPLTQSNNKGSESAVQSESQRATITVMAAHLEANNRTFFLSSPDSGVSTHCRFSPPAHKDPVSPAFRWPSPSLSAPSLTTDASLSPTLHPKPQSSPPIPPKRMVRSPKLGTSSLSASFSSPVPLPELPKLGNACISTSVSSPVPLPELPMLFLVSAKEGHFKVHAENGGAASDRWHKPHHHNSAWNCSIKEEEEEEERKEGARKTPATSPTSRVAGLVNGAAVWKEFRNKAPANLPPMTEPGTAPPSVPDNGACQEDTAGTGADEGGRQNVSMRAKQLLHVGSTELLAAGNGPNNQESNPPPPPPKKLYRVSVGKLSGSNLELDRWSQQGSMESSTSSLRGLGSSSLQTASTDSLDAGSRDATRRSCSSPFPKSPAGSTPGSPRPPSSSSNQPPPLPEKKMVNRTVSAPDSGRGFVRAYPRLPFAGSDANPRSSLPSSPVDPRPIFASNDSLERCHAPAGRPSRSQTLDEPFKVQGRLGFHCRSSHTCSSSPQLSTPPVAPEAAHLGSTLQLQTLLSNIDSREGVYSKLGGLYAESLRRLALKCEDHFTRSQKNTLRFEESNWSLFRLTSNKPSCVSGDAVYFSAACASDPRNSYAVKICKSASSEAKQGHLYGLSVQQSVPPHFNLQQDCGHFLACVPQSMLPADKVSPPPGVSGQQGERVVVITPEIPQQTAADFAREWQAFHKSQPEVYERRVCFLLLQLCHCLEHLKEHGVTHRDLCLENLLLVPHNSRRSDPEPPDVQRQLPRLLISNFAKSKRRSAETGASTAVDPRFKRDHARLAPEIVSAAQYRKFDEFQTGILIYELLHQPNPFEVRPALKEQDYRCQDLPPIPAVSLYSAGLHKLAQLLLQPDPIKRIHIQEAKRVLQSLLWGPRKDLMEQPQEGRGADASRHESLLNWLDVKRALLMMKFAERSLEPERNAELEDWLCCQYFSSANPLSLCHTAELLYALKH